MAVLFKYSDVDGDRLAVFDAAIPSLSDEDKPIMLRGVNIKTDQHGCSIPDGDIPELIEALSRYIGYKSEA